MPIFIAGCGRSGTSYLRTLLDAHPDVFIPSESLFITDYLGRAHNVPGPVWRYLLAREPQLLCWFDGPLPSRPDVAATLAHIHERAAKDRGARYWGQKTPRFVRHRGLIEAAFAGVYWILIYRDPRAVVASMLGSGQHPYAPSLAIDRWRRDNAEIVDSLRSEQSPNNVFILSYEELVRDTEYAIAEILRFLDLDPVPLATLKAKSRPVFFSRSRFPVNTMRHGIGAVGPRIDAWRDTLPPSVVREIEHRCQGEMDALGYRRLGGAHTRLSRWAWRGRNALGWLKQPWIVARYLWYWPEYPIWVLVRKSVLALWPRRAARQN